MTTLRSRIPGLAFYLGDDGLVCELGEVQVGYIRVDSKNRVKFIIVAPQYRRKGVATALYEEMAKHLATVGAKLYASDYQHDNAIAVWNWLKTNAGNRVGTAEDGRLFLSYL